MSIDKATPDSIDILASATVSRGSVDYLGASKQITARIPLREACYLEVIAEHTKLSRNRVVSLLLDNAIESYFSEISPNKEVTEKITNDFNKKFEEALKSNDFQNSNGDDD